jgi:hypothetical protein
MILNNVTCLSYITNQLRKGLMIVIDRITVK